MYNGGGSGIGNLSKPACIYPILVRRSRLLGPAASQSKEQTYTWAAFPNRWPNMSLRNFLSPLVESSHLEFCATTFQVSVKPLSAPIWRHSFYCYFLCSILIFVVLFFFSLIRCMCYFFSAFTFINLHVFFPFFDLESYLFQYPASLFSIITLPRSYAEIRGIFIERLLIRRSI